MSHGRLFLDHVLETLFPKSSEPAKHDTKRKLGLESLEVREMLSVNPLGPDNDDSGSYIAPLSYEGIPAVPTGLYAVTVSPVEATLVWNASPGAECYMITRRDSETGQWITIANNVTDLSYTVDDLRADRTYRFGVHAINEYGMSAGCTQDLTLAPNSIEAIALSPTSAKIVWSESLGASQYRVTRYDSVTKTWTTLSNNVTGNSYTATDLLADRSYKFGVHAINSAGASNGTTNFLTTSPAEISAVATSPTSAKIVWTESPEASAYQLTRYDDVSRQWTAIASNISGNSYEVDGLDPARNYKFGIHAVNGAGMSYGKTEFLTAAPDIVSAVEVSATETTIAWTASTAANVYQVERVDRSSGQRTVLVADLSGTSCTLSSSDLAGNVDIVVRAVNAAGTSYDSRSSFFLNLQDGLSAISVSSSVTQLAWQNLSGVSAYQIHCYDLTTGRWTVLETEYSGNSYTATGLVENRNYVFAVRPSTASGPISNGRLATSAPKGVEAIKTSWSTAQIVWNASPGATKYRVTCWDSVTGQWTTLASEATGTSYSATNLKNDRSYKFAVHAINEAGTSVGAANILVEAPASVSAIAVSTHSAQIVWNESDGATKYRITCWDDITGQWRTLSSDATGGSFTATDLLTDRTYRFAVHALNSAGASEGTSVYLTKAPADVAVVETSPGTAKIVWNAVSGAQKYTVTRYDDVTGQWIALASNITETGYIIEGLYANRNYRFAVHASNDAGLSYGTASFLTRPPENVRITSASGNTATIDWDAVAGARGYVVTCYDDVSRQWKTVARNVTGTTFTFEGLLSDRNYRFGVHAVNEAGESYGTTIGFEQNPIQVRIDSVRHASENGLSGYVRLWRNITDRQLTVYYHVGGTATAGDDYSALDGSVTFEIGAEYVDIPIEARPDFKEEGQEFVEIALYTKDGCFYNIVPEYGKALLGVSDIDSPPYESVVTNYFYDEAGRLLKEESSDGSRIEYRYDSQGRMIETKYSDSSSSESTRYEYDESGLLSHTDNPSNRTNYQYDENGKLVSTSQFDKTTESVTLTVVYEYDEQGRLVKKVDGNGVFVEYLYSEDGILKAEIDSAGWIYSYEYDSDNRLISKTSRYDFYHGVPLSPRKATAVLSGSSGTAVWDSVQDAGSYQLSYYDDLTRSWVVFATNITGNSHDLGGRLFPEDKGPAVLNGEISKIAVQTVSLFGVSARKEIPLTQAPQGLSAVMMSETSARISWKASEGADTYRVFYYDTESRTWTLLASELRGTSYIAKDLILDASSRFAVEAVNDAGTTNRSVQTIVPAFWIESTRNASRGNSDENSGYFRIYRNDFEQEITVSFTLGGSAKEGTDYQTIPHTVTFLQGQEYVDIFIETLIDFKRSGDKTVSLKLVSCSINGNDPCDITRLSGDMPISASLTIVDNLAPNPPVSIQAVQNEGYFLIERIAKGHHTEEVVVHYTISGSAKNGIDYQYLSGSIVLPKGVYSVRIPIDTIGEGLRGRTETITITLAAGDGYELDGQYYSRSATLSVTDNAVKSTVRIESTRSALEGGDPGGFRIYRSETSGPLIVRYTVGGTASEGNDYLAIPRSVVFADGQEYVDVPVHAIQDSLREGFESIIVTLSSNDDYDIDSSNKQCLVQTMDRVAARVGFGDVGPDVWNSSGFVTLYRENTHGSLTVNYHVSGNVYAGYLDQQGYYDTVTFEQGQNTVLIPIPNDTPRTYGEITVTILPDASYELDTQHAQLRIHRELPNHSKPNVGISSIESASVNDEYFHFRLWRDLNFSQELTVGYQIHLYTGYNFPLQTWIQTGTATFGVGQQYVDVSYPVPKDFFQQIPTEQNSAEGGNVTGGGMGDPWFRLNITLLENSEYERENSYGQEIYIPSSGSGSSNPGNANLPTVRIAEVQNTVYGGENGYVRIYRESAFLGEVVYKVSGFKQDGSYFEYQNRRISFSDGQNHADIFFDSDIVYARIDLLPGSYYKLSENESSDTSCAIWTIDYFMRTEKTTVRVDSVVDTYGGVQDGGYFRLYRENADGLLIVHYTLSGSAVVGVDYSAMPLAAIFADGEHYVDIPILALGDNASKAKTVTLNLLSDKPFYTVDPTYETRTMAISPLSERPAVRVEKIQDGIEGVQNGLFRIYRSNTKSVLDVYFNSSESSNYRFDPPGMVQFAVGQSYVDIRIEVIDDNVSRPTEDVFLSLLNNPFYSVDAVYSSASLHIIDNDTKPTIGIVEIKNAQEGISNGFIKLQRDHYLDAVTVYYTIEGTAVSGADYKPTTGSVSFKAGQQFAYIPIVPVDNDVYEGDKTIVVTISPDNQHYRIDPQHGSGTLILEDDEFMTHVRIEAVSNAEEGGNDGYFRIFRDVYDKELTVEYHIEGTAENGIDYLYLDGNVTFLAGQRYVDIPITAFDDNRLESTETVTITVSTDNPFVLVDEEQSVATLYIADRTPTPPGIDYLQLKNKTGSSDDENRSSDITVVGKISGTEYLAYTEVEFFFHFGDGEVILGSAFTDKDGLFTFVPPYLLTGKALYARTVNRSETNPDEHFIYGEPQSILIYHERDISVLIPEISLSNPKQGNPNVSNAPSVQLSYTGQSGDIVFFEYSRKVDGEWTAPETVFAAYSELTNGMTQAEFSGIVFLYDLLNIRESEREVEIRVRVCLQDNVNFIDPNDVFDEENDPLVYRGEWHDYTFLFENAAVQSREITSLSLKKPLENEPNKTTDPAISGTVTASDSQYPVSVEVFHQGTLIGKVTANVDGSFIYNTKFTAPGQYTLVFRTVQWNAYANEYQYGASQNFSFELLPAVLTVPAISSFVLTDDTGIKGDRITSNAHLQGRLVQDGSSLNRVLIEFDYDGDGTVDAFVYTDSSGRFTHDPSLSLGNHVVRARATRMDAISGTWYTGQWTSLSFTLTEADRQTGPSVTEIGPAFANGSKDGLQTSDSPILAGRVSSEGGFDNVRVQIDLGADGFVDYEGTVRSDGTFRWNPNLDDTVERIITGRVRAGGNTWGEWTSFTYHYIPSTDDGSASQTTNGPQLKLIYTKNPSTGNVVATGVRIIGTEQLAGHQVRFDLNGDGKTDLSLTTDAQGIISFDRIQITEAMKLEEGLLIGTVSLANNENESSVRIAVIHFEGGNATDRAELQSLQNDFYKNYVALLESFEEMDQILQSVRPGGAVADAGETLTEEQKAQLYVETLAKLGLTESDLALLGAYAPTPLPTENWDQLPDIANDIEYQQEISRINNYYYAALSNLDKTAAGLEKSAEAAYERTVNSAWSTYCTSTVDLELLMSNPNTPYAVVYSQAKKSASASTAFERSSLQATMTKVNSTLNSQKSNQLSALNYWANAARQSAQAALSAAARSGNAYTLQFVTNAVNEMLANIQAQVAYNTAVINAQYTAAQTSIGAWQTASSNMISANATAQQSKINAWKALRDGAVDAEKEYEQACQDASQKRDDDLKDAFDEICKKDKEAADKYRDEAAKLGKDASEETRKLYEKFEKGELTEEEYREKLNDIYHKYSEKHRDLSKSYDEEFISREKEYRKQCAEIEKTYAKEKADADHQYESDCIDLLETYWTDVQDADTELQRNSLEISAGYAGSLNGAESGLSSSLLVASTNYSRSVTNNAQNRANSDLQTENAMLGEEGSDYFREYFAACAQLTGAAATYYTAIGTIDQNLFANSLTASTTLVSTLLGKSFGAELAAINVSDGYGTSVNTAAGAYADSMLGVSQEYAGAGISISDNYESGMIAARVAYMKAANDAQKTAAKAQADLAKETTDKRNEYLAEKAKEALKTFYPSHEKQDECCSHGYYPTPISLDYYPDRYEIWWNGIAHFGPISCLISSSDPGLQNISAEQSAKAKKISLQYQRDLAKASDSYVSSVIGHGKQAAKSSVQAAKAALEGELNAADVYCEAVENAAQAANEALIDIARNADPTDEIIGYLKSMAEMETNAEIAKMQALGVFQTASKRELLATIPRTDARYDALLAEIEWTETTVQARNEYYAKLGAASISYQNTTLDAMKTYNSASMQRQATYQKASLQGEKTYSSAIRAASNNAQKMQQDASSSRELALIDAAFGEFSGNSQYEFDRAEMMYGNYSFSLDSLLDDKDFTGDFVSFSGSFAAKESENAANLVYYKDMQAAARKSAEAAAGNLYNSTVRSADINYVRDLAAADVAYFADQNVAETDYLQAETTDYLSYISTIQTAEKAFADEQCRLMGLLQDSVDTGYNTVSSGTGSLDVQVCFRAGTPVIMADDSTKKIEKIVLDDLVFARPHDDPTGPLRVCRVTRLYHNQPKPIWKATFDSGLFVEATLEHPFYVQEKGWVSLNDLQIGDSCVNVDGEKITLVSKEFVTEEEPVYNFEVEDAHTYFVGTCRKDSVLVHNDCSCSGSGLIQVCSISDEHLRIIAETSRGQDRRLSNPPKKAILCSCQEGKYNIQWIGGWSAPQKLKIINALDMMKSKIDILISEVDDLENQLTKDEYDQVRDHMFDYRKVLEGIKSVLDNKDKLKISQKAFWFSDADGKYYMLWKNVSLNTNEDFDWEKRSAVELATLLYHEISHQYGTEDDNRNGPFMNAHNIDNRMNHLLLGFELDLSGGSMLRQLISTPNKNKQ